MNLIYNGRELPSGAVATMDAYCPGWREETGDPRMYLMTAPDKVRFVPASDSTQTIAVNGLVAVMPARNATTFGDELLEFSEAITAGALARLQKMAGKSWMDLNVSQINQGIYMEGLSTAKMEAMRSGQTDATLNPITLA